MKAIELALFRLKPEADETAFLSAVAATERWLAGQPGFILRRHGRGGDGERIDYVEWESMEHAKAAAEKFHGAPECRDFMNAIDHVTVSMRHFELVC